MEPRDRGPVRRQGAVGGQPETGRSLRHELRRGGHRGAQGASRGRDPLSRAAGLAPRRRRSPAAERHDRAAAPASRRRDRGERVGADCRGRQRAREARGAAAGVGEDGVDRPACGRRRARGQHAADRHRELHADAAGGREPGGSEDAAAREDRAADVPRREDRQRAAQPLPSERRGADRPRPRRHERGRQRRARRCSSTSSRRAR